MAACAYAQLSSWVGRVGRCDAECTRLSQVASQHSQGQESHPIRTLFSYIGNLQQRYFLVRIKFLRLHTTVLGLLKIQSKVRH